MLESTPRGAFMPILAELPVRISLGCEFLLRMLREDGRFASWHDPDANATPSPVTDHLIATSIITAAHRELGLTHISKEIDKLITVLSDMTFDANNDVRITDVTDGSKSQVWDSLAYLTLARFGKEDKGYIKPIVSRGTLGRIHPGIVLNALVNAFKIEEDQQYLDTAIKFADAVCDNNRISGYDAWGLASVHQLSPDDRYVKCITNMSNAVLNNMGMIHDAVGLVVPISLQIHLAHQYVDTDLRRPIKNRIANLFEMVCKSQIDGRSKIDDDTIGAFVREPSDKVIKITYITQCLTVLLQYYLTQKFVNISNLF